MSKLLARALQREFPGESLNRLLVEHLMARLAHIKALTYIVIP
jgi:hypothetical protein